METYSSSGPDPAAARSALNDVASARGRVADRVGSPWWYRVALGLSMALTFVALGVGGDVALLGAVIGGAGVPPVLTWAANRSTGVSLDRYRAGPAAVYLVGLFVLVGAGLWARYGLDVSWAMVVAGVGALLLTLVMEPRIDAAVRRDLRTTR